MPLHRRKFLRLAGAAAVMPTLVPTTWRIAYAADYPTRAAYKLTIDGQYRRTPPDPHLKSVITPLGVVHGRTIKFGIDFRNPTRAKFLTVTIAANGRSDTYLIDNDATRGSHEHLDVTVTPTSTSLAGRIIRKTSSSAADKTELQVMIGSATNAKEQPNAFYFRRLGVAQRNGEQWILLPGEEINGYLSPDPVTIAAR